MAFRLRKLKVIEFMFLIVLKKFELLLEYLGCVGLERNQAGSNPSAELRARAKKIVLSAKLSYAVL